jgi:hypothetical protein
MAIAMVPLAASFAYAAENPGWLALQGVAGATRSDCLSWKPISAGQSPRDCPQATDSLGLLSLSPVTIRRAAGDG